MGNKGSRLPEAKVTHKVTFDISIGNETIGRAIEVCNGTN